MLDVLDALKVADSVLFLVSTSGIDSVGEVLLTASLAQGLPSTTTAVVDISTVPIKVLVVTIYLHCTSNDKVMVSFRSIIYQLKCMSDRILHQ